MVLAVLLATGGAWFPGHAWAQATAGIGALPGGTAGTLASPPADARPQDGPAAQDAAATARQAPDSFMINAFDVTGATKLSELEMQTIVDPFLGPNRTNMDVIAVQKALQAAYAAKGYGGVQVDVPVQSDETFAQGIVQIAIRETPVGRVRVVGAEHHALATVRAQVPSLTEGQPIDFRALQRDVSQANRVSDRSVDPTFRPGQVPGTLDVDLTVKDSRPLHASLALDNDNSPNTEPLRLAASIRHTDLWGAGHTASLTYSVAPRDRQQSEVFSGSYNVPLIGTPWSFLLYGYTSNSNVAALGGTNVLGNGYQLGVRSVYRLPSDTFQQISFGFDYKDFNERVSLSGDALDPTPVRYLSLVAEYTLGAASETDSYGLTFGVTGGFRAFRDTRCASLGDVDPGSAPICELSGGGVGVPVSLLRDRRLNANENFVHFNLDMNYAHSFPGDYVAAFRFAGQLADSPLLTNEQFGLGGVTSVRGYYLSEAIGDDGLVGSVEFRFPEIGSKLGLVFDELRFYGFADIGYAHVRSPALEQASDFTLASLGGGVRYRLFNALSGEFLIGVPIKDGPESRSGDPRYSFSIKGEF
jgi:hemolysin activation/secretion protein